MFHSVILINGHTQQNLYLQLSNVILYLLYSATSQQSWTRGQWVAVIYDEEWWPGIIMEVINDSCTINFMKPSSSYNKFAWPEKEETDIVSSDSILSLLPEPPIPISRRHFALNAKLADDVTAKMKMVLTQ